MAGADNLGKKAGDAIKGAWHMVHGAGEVVRGTINDTLDSFGDTVANREHRHDGTSAKGWDEVSQGRSDLTGDAPPPSASQGEHGATSDPVYHSQSNPQYQSGPTSTSAEQPQQVPSSTSAAQQGGLFGGIRSVYDASEKLRMKINSSIDQAGEAIVHPHGRTDAPIATTTNQSYHPDPAVQGGPVQTHSGPALPPHHEDVKANTAPEPPAADQAVWSPVPKPASEPAPPAPAPTQ